MSALESRVRSSAKLGVAKVAGVLAAAGTTFDQNLSPDVEASMRLYPAGNLFHRCVAEAAIWAGFVSTDDPDWRRDAIQYLTTQAPHLKPRYRKSYRGAVSPIDYLDSWFGVLADRNVPSPPDGRTDGHELVRFFQDVFTVLKQADWRGARAGLGPWSFHGSFKIYLLHERRLWVEQAMDAITLPMGGRLGGEFSFEHGWSVLESLGIVSPLPAGKTFSAKMAATQQAHAGVQALAALADARALHVNSGIYLLGSE